MCFWIYLNTLNTSTFFQKDDCFFTFFYFFFLQFSLCYQQNSHKENRMLEKPLVFTGRPGIQFVNSPLLLTQLVRLPGYPLTVQLLCYLQDAMPLHWLPSTSHLNPCLWNQRISLGVASILTICVSSYFCV